MAQITSSEQRAALIYQVGRGCGPPALLRRFQQARRAHAGFSAEKIAAMLVDTGLAEKGRSYKEHLERREIGVKTIFDADYPALLKVLDDPPLVLFYRGDPDVLQRPCFGIVGSRACSEYGRQATLLFAGRLAESGVTVVSGLALGIDGRAHEAALAVNGPTAAVLGSGLDRLYPSAHRGLARAVLASGGALISEFPPDAAARPFHFPVRNRIISGLCRGILVVEAGERSGSLITANHCLDQGRELFAVPGSLHLPGSRGTNALIARGEAHLARLPEDILKFLQIRPAPVSVHRREAEKFSKDSIAGKIYDTLDAFVPVPLDTIVAELGLASGTVAAKLMQLEAHRLVERRPGRFYLRNPLVAVV